MLDSRRGYSQQLVASRQAASLGGEPDISSFGKLYIGGYEADLPVVVLDLEGELEGIFVKLEARLHGVLGVDNFLVASCELVFVAVRVVVIHFHPIPDHCRDPGICMVCGLVLEDVKKHPQAFKVILVAKGIP